jgi:hypothetical protein
MLCAAAETPLAVFLAAFFLYYNEKQHLSNTFLPVNMLGL